MKKSEKYPLLDLEKFILEKIRSNEWSPSTKIPSIRKLSSEFGVNSATSRRILEELTKKGILVAVHGSGTFVREDFNSSMPFTSHEKNILVMMPDMPEIDYLKEEALNKSILISHYCTGKDGQSPEKEKQLLLAAMRNKYMGVILSPTPKVPTNQDLFRKMRENGMKVLLIGYYDFVPAMADESYLLPDFAAASRAAVVKMTLSGYENIVYLHKGANNALYQRILRNGYDEAVKELSLNALPPVDISAENILEAVAVRRLPRSTAIVTPNPLGAEDIKKAIEDTGRASSGDLALICCCGNPIPRGVDCLTFDYQTQVEEALAYICESSIGSSEVYHELFNAVFYSGKHECGSLRCAESKALPVESATHTVNISSD
ncbi:MAG: GntR family transcriptional regulator [Planctomycetes bacterium]|nr:GntR family transcriptional regulator [Planctomycetota bacterium]